MDTVGRCQQLLLGPVILGLGHGAGHGGGIQLTVLVEPFGELHVLTVASSSIERIRAITDTGTDRSLRVGG